MPLRFIAALVVFISMVLPIIRCQLGHGRKHETNKHDEEKLPYIPLLYDRHSDPIMLPATILNNLKHYIKLQLGQPIVPHERPLRSQLQQPTIDDLSKANSQPARPTETEASLLAPSDHSAVIHRRSVADEFEPSPFRFLNVSDNANQETVSPAVVDETANATITSVDSQTEGNATSSAEDTKDEASEIGYRSFLDDFTGSTALAVNDMAGSFPDRRKREDDQTGDQTDAKRRQLSVHDFVLALIRDGKMTRRAKRRVPLFAVRSNESHGIF